MPAAVVGGGVVAETVVDDPESVFRSGPYRVSARLHTVRRSLRGGWGCSHLWFVSTAATKQR
jgi:hypothetical protein